MVKFLIQSDWGQTHLQTPSPTQSQDTPSPTQPQATPSPTPPDATPSPTQAAPLESQPSSPEQQDDSVQMPQESEQKVQEQEETPEESEQQTQADAQTQQQTSSQPVTFNKSLAVQQALIAAASMGYTEVTACWCHIIFCMLFAPIATNFVCVFKIVSYLLDLPERDEEDTQRAQINSYDTLWGETGKASLLQDLSYYNCILKSSEAAS